MDAADGEDGEGEEGGECLHGGGFEVRVGEVFEVRWMESRGG